MISPFKKLSHLAIGSLIHRVIDSLLAFIIHPSAFSLSFVESAQVSISSSVDQSSRFSMTQ